MAAADALSSCAAAAEPEEAASVGAVASSVALVARERSASDAAAPSVDGRGPARRKPKIDIDNEIQEANRLAELFRKMQAASKVAARNATRSKQRLIRKANKLSEQDLMRLAVLKRCGIFAVEEDGVVPVAPTADAAVSPAKKSKAHEHISGRFKTLVSSVPGAAEVLDGLDKAALPGVSSGSASSTSLASMSLSMPLPPSVGLKRLPSRPSTPVSRKKTSVSKVPAESDDGVEDHTVMESAVDDEE